jgi:hypothetical protein
MRTFLRRYRWWLHVLGFCLAAGIWCDYLSRLDAVLSARMYDRIQIGMPREEVNRIMNWPTAPSLWMNSFWNDIQFHKWRQVEQEEEPPGTDGKVALSTESATWLDERLGISVGYRDGKVIWKGLYAPSR